MRIAIVDDLAEERKKLRDRLEARLERRFLHAEICEFENGEAFWATAREQRFTVLFLDIYMDGANGIEIARALRGFDPDCLLIFTTTSSDHALEGFRVRALHYLVKPYSDEDLDTLTDELLRHIPAPDKYIEIKINGSEVRLPLGDILYAEHFSHQMMVHTASGKTLTTRQTFSAFTTPLKGDLRYFVCSRGVIVNLDHATDFDGTSFVMENGSKIGVSRDLQKSARQTFMEHLFKRGHK